VTDFLAGMAASSRERLYAARRERSEATLVTVCRELPPPVPIRWDGFGVIAEVKRHSPSAGVLSADAAADAQSRLYQAAGASAVSVLTEPERFAGSLDDLEAVSTVLAGSGVPAMRKDFLVDPYQVLEARAAGAGGVLVIVAMLDDPGVAELLDAAIGEGLFVLLEAFDERDLERGARLAEGRGGQVLMGLNARDLRTLEVDPGRLARLAAAFPPGWPKVAESGLLTAADAGAMAASGYDLALVGSALMKSEQPARLLEAMIAAGRAAETAA
jgi:indole-3-glycerol phosphate synthase